MGSPLRDLWVSIVQTSGARVYSMVTGVATLFITARLLGPEGRGQIAAITTWVTLFATIAGLSLGQVALNHLAEDKEHQNFGKQLGSLFVLAFLLSAVAGGVAVAMYLLPSKSPFGGLVPFLLFLGFLTLPFLVWEQYGSNLLMGLERLKIYNGYQILGRTLTVLFIFLLVAWIKWGVLGVLVSNLVGQAVVAVGGIGFLLSCAKKWGVKIRFNKNTSYALLKDGMKLHLNAIGTLLFSSVNILLLNYYCSAEDTGLFQMAVQLVSVLLVIPQAASMSLYGKLVSIGPNKAWPIHRKLLIQIMLLMIAIAIVAFFSAPLAVSLLAGKEFQPTVAIFQWLLGGLIGMTFSTLMASQWIVRGLFWQASLITLGVGVLNLGVSLWLIPIQGIYGAVYAFLITYTIAAFSNGGMAWYCQKKHTRTAS